MLVKKQPMETSVKRKDIKIDDSNKNIYISGIKSLCVQRSIQLRSPCTSTKSYQDFAVHLESH